MEILIVLSVVQKELSVFGTRKRNFVDETVGDMAEKNKHLAALFLF